MAGGWRCSRDERPSWYLSFRKWRIPLHNYVLLYLSLVETHEFQRQNNSITESSIRALAARIKQNHPELTRTLMGLGKYTGLTSAHTVRNIPQLEDVVAKTYHVLGSALTDITTGVISSNQVERNKLWGELIG